MFGETAAAAKLILRAGVSKLYVNADDGVGVTIAPIAEILHATVSVTEVKAGIAMSLLVGVIVTTILYVPIWFVNVGLILTLLEVLAVKNAT